MPGRPGGSPIWRPDGIFRSAPLWPSGLCSACLEKDGNDKDSRDNGNNDDSRDHKDNIGLGELVRFHRPPAIGRSTSFCCFVHAVRAVRGEAKLCGRMWDVVLIAGPPGCWDGRVFFAVHLALTFCAQARGFQLNLHLSSSLERSLLMQFG
jgi:hypothetical protein